MPHRVSGWRHEEAIDFPTVGTRGGGTYTITPMDQVEEKAKLCVQLRRTTTGVDSASAAATGRV